MKKFVLINTLEKVKKFAAQACKVDGFIYVRQGRYGVCGKSLLGIFSLDLLKPVEVEYPESATEFEQYLQTLE